MRTETNASKDRASGIIPIAPWRVHTVRPLDSYRLYVKFMDESEGFVDLSELVTSDKAGVFMALRDPHLFKSVYINHGAVTWPGNLDLAPDAMYDVIKDKGEWVVT